MSLQKLIEVLVRNELSSIIFEKRKKRTKPQIMFHGTTSKFLPRIFQLGVVPNPKAGKWKGDISNDDSVDANRRSLKSLEGSYWTTNVGTAFSAGNNTRRKFGGNSIFIIAEIVPQTGKADEDSVEGSIDRAFAASIVPWFGARSIPEAAVALQGILDADSLNGGTTEKQITKDFSKQLHNSLKINDKMPMDEKMLGKVFHVYLERILGHMDIENGDKKWEYLENYRRELEKGTGWSQEDAKKMMDKKTNNIPKFDSGIGEENYSKALDWVSGRYKKSTFVGDDEDFGVNLRVTQPVGFRGRNKIIAILDSPKEETNLILIYGNKVPNEFIVKWKDFWGPNFKIIDQNGKILYDAMK